MTIALLHLTDIHIAKATDPVLKRVKEIVSCLNPTIHSVTSVVIVISGDIAQSGAKKEYALAKIFVDEIVSTIKIERNLPVMVILAAGNHDCDFDGDQEARLAIVGNIHKKVGDVPLSYIQSCTAVQSEFFKFRKGFEENLEIVSSDALWTTYSLNENGKTIHVDVLNASWMSTIYEKQGNLLFPYERYDTKMPTDANLRIGVLHHPFSWYGQSNVHKFRAFMHTLEDVILTGHEHQSSSRIADDAQSGECAYVEGAALQDRNSAESGFNIVQIDLEKQCFIYQSYQLRDGIYKKISNFAEWQDYRKLPKRKATELALTPEFEKSLLDPGASLMHPSGRTVQLEDIYVFPDMDVRGKREEAPRGQSQKTSSKIFLQPGNLSNDLLIEGDESAGKTKLLYRLYSQYHSVGLLPLLIRGGDIKSSSKKELDRLVQSAIAAQYGREQVELFMRASKQKKYLLIDDFESTILNHTAKATVILGFRTEFNKLLLTVGENYELSALFDAQQLGEAGSFNQYRLLPLGFERRAELVQKWNSIGADETVSGNQFLATCDEAEKLIESTRLQHVASTVPIFVLSLLQAAASGATNELRSSSFAHYYHFLIIGALQKGGVKPNEMDPYIAACTHLSWFIKNNGVDLRISREQFQNFVVRYSDDWTQTDHSSLLLTLLEARLLEEDADSIYFTYPYAYYYFLGRYASISIDSQDVREYMHFCMKNLYVRECANTLLFLAHHTANNTVLDGIVAALDEHFSGYTPATLSKGDVKTVSSLFAYAPQLAYKARKPQIYRQENNRHKDSTDTGHDALDESPNGTDKPRDLFQEMVSLQKSIEIAGALLTHQFPNYSRIKKDAAIRAIFDSSLRAIKVFFSHFDADKDQLLKAISLKVKGRNTSLTLEDVERETRGAIGLLLRGISTYFINNAGMHVSSKDVASNVAGVMGTNPTSAYRLINLSQALQRPARLPRLEINKLVKDEADNVCVMGVLQMLVLHRLYMYEADYDDRDWAVSIFNLGGAAKAIEMKHHNPAKRRWG